MRHEKRWLNKILTHHGFTLIETMVALLILSTSIILLVNSWGGSFMRLKKSETAFETASMIQRKMADLELKYRNNVANLPEEEAGDFGSDFPNYKWKVTSKELQFPDISSTLSAREGGVDEMTQTIVKQMVDQISKSVKEVTLTIILKNPKKKTDKDHDLEYSVTTYFVDYDQGVSLPGGGGGSASPALPVGGGGSGGSSGGGR